MKHPEGELMAFEQSLRHTTKPKSREVSSRFLSQTPLGNVVNSPTNAASPIRQGSGRSSSFNGKHNNGSVPADSGFMRGLWPAAGSSSSSGSSDAKQGGTLAECFRNERKMDIAQQQKNLEKPEKSMNPVGLIRQQSCKEPSEFANERRISKENHKPLFGGSMRYTGKFKFPGRSSKSSKSPNLSDNDNNIVAGRLSVDETALRRRSLGRKSDHSLDFSVDSGSEQSDVLSGTSFNSPASYMKPTVSSRMSGIEVSSKYMQDSLLKSHRSSTDSAENSPKKFTLKSAIKRSNSGKTRAFGESPGRGSSFSEESKGKGMSKPPTSPSRVKGVGNLLSIGLELLKGKKSYQSVSSPLGLGINGESVHQLRLFHNRLVQWRYANARAEAVNRHTSEQAKRNLVCASDGLTKLRNSVRQKKMQLEKEKLQVKLNHILRSQIKSLESWGAMERQHQSAINMTKDSLHSVVCKVPLVEGAKAEPQSFSLALRYVSDITGTIMMMNSKFSPKAHETAAASRELVEIAFQEKLFLEECLEHFKIVSALEVEEASLKCSLMQLKLQSEQQHQHQTNQEICS